MSSFVYLPVALQAELQNLTCIFKFQGTILQSCPPPPTAWKWHLSSETERQSHTFMTTSTKRCVQRGSAQTLLMPQRGTFQPWYTSNPSFIYLISSSSLIFLPPDMVNLKFLKKKIQECCHCPSPTQLIELFFYYYYCFLISVFNTRQQLMFHLLFLKPCAHDIT